MRSWAILFVVLAGCGTPSVDPAISEQEVVASAMPYLESLIDNRTTAYDMAIHGPPVNMVRVAYHNGVGDSQDPNDIPGGGYFTESVITDDYAYMARQSGDSSFGGFSILNLRKDANGTPRPHLVGAFNAHGGGDIEITADQAYAFLATQRNSIEDVVRRGSDDPQQNATGAPPRGIYVVDIRDKSNPAQAAFMPIPYNGAHTITYVRHADGREYVVAATYDLLGNTIPVDSVPPVPIGGGALPGTHRLEIYEFLRDSAQLLRRGTYQLLDQAPQGRMFLPHDTSVQVHPVTNKTVMYVSYWDKGVRILDFTTPASPVEIGFWNDFSPSSENAIHWARPFDRPLGGRNILVAEPEIIQNEHETGYITFIDVTEASRPKKATPQSHWTLPLPDLGVQNLDVSPHNFDTFGSKVALAHNHAGLWIIDASDLNHPRTAGWTADTEARADAPRPKPFFWGAWHSDGLIYAVDEATGLYVYQYTGS